MRQLQTLLAFNRGLVSPLGLARVDQKRVEMGAETMTNWVPRVLGSMTLRPGLKYIGATASNAAAKMIPFVFATGDTALIELTDSVMRVWISDALLTRPSVSTAVTNGTFAGNITGWTDGSDSGGAAAYDSVGGSFLKLTSNGTARAIAYQFITVAAPDVSVEHGLHIVIDRGPVTLRIGSTLGGNEYVGAELGAGVHSIGFTPTSSFYVQFSATTIYKTRITSVAVESSGTVTLATPWAAANLANVRYDQSGDIMFVACTSVQQRKIERRQSGRSWSVAVYQPADGPFRTQNLTPITLTASATTGDITVTASTPLFASTYNGSLFSLTVIGQTQTKTISAENTFSSSVRITGVGAARAMGLVITGLSATGSTVTLQQSVDNASFADYTTYTADQSTSVTDGLDNQTIYYRIGVKTGGYSSGTIVCTLTFTAGTQTGIVRLTGYTSTTVMSAQVLTQLGATTATSTWAEGDWSDYRGWPGSIIFHEGRLWWSGKAEVWGSVSDAYDSFDDSLVGDAGPINRTIGSGPIDTVNWMMSLQRMIIGTGGAEYSVRSSSFDEPLTPTNFNMKAASTQGSAAVQSIKIDQRGIFVQRSGMRVYEVSFDVQNYDYTSKDITALVPELCSPGITRCAVQRQPDTRGHFVLSDGTVVLSVLDKNEDVLCWCKVTTDGTVEDVVVLPGDNASLEDQVYYVVNRTINGSTVRYLEKWALETECRGAALNKQADAFITYSGAPATHITGLSHLEGESVVAWGDSTDLSPDVSGVQTTYTVSGGAIDLTAAYAEVVVGLPYTAQWKSSKLGHALSIIQSQLTQQKRISHVGFIMAYAHPKGVTFGNDFTNMDELPSIEEGAAVTALRTSYDEQEIPFPASWTTDQRICFQAKAPRPVTLMAAVVDLMIHD